MQEKRIDCFKAIRDHDGETTNGRGGRKMSQYVPLEAKTHTPPYKIHRYFARRPWNVFKQLIELYSEKGDIILDPFCGGGVTVYEGIKLGRKVIGFDLNPLSTFIVRNMVRKDYDSEELISAYKQITQYLNLLYSDYNKIELVTNQETLQKTLVKTLVPAEWNELAFVVKCNFCDNEVILSNDNKISNGRYTCPNLSCSGNKNHSGYIEPKNCQRVGYKYLHSVVTSPINNQRIHVAFDIQRKEKLREHIFFLKGELKKNGIVIPTDEIPLNWDRQHEDLLLRKGIKTFQDLFTKRNLLINLLLLNFIKSLRVGKDTYEILRLVFSSSLRDTNIMAFTQKGWQGGKPTTWSKHAYWIPSQFCEVNVLFAFKRAFNRVKKALEYNNRFDYQPVKARDFKDLLLRCNVLLENCSLDESNIPDNSIDAIITDPPYGSNVQYLELSHFWYPWNRDMYGDKKPNFSKEAVSNRKRNFEGAKTLKDYENNLYSVFDRCYDVLKPGKYMVLTFNNKDFGAWLALLISISRAGFSLVKGGLFFQSGIKNYRQTAHTKYKGSPYGDFIYVFQKKPKHVANEKIISETEFVQKLESVFKRHMMEFEKAGYDKNEAIARMVLDAIPKIEAFVRSRLSHQKDHNIYERYNNNYLKKLYLHVKKEPAEIGGG